MAKRIHESRDVAHLRLNDFSLGAFQPYTVDELEKFNTNYNEELERPIIVSMNGYILHGRKRFEAARLRAHTLKKRVSLACLVDPMTDSANIYRTTAELMAEDLDHEYAPDRTVAKMCLEYAFGKKKFKLLRDLIATGTRNGVTTYTAQLRQKVYGSPIVSYEARRHAEANHLEFAALVRLIRMAEKEFSGIKGSPVLAHRNLSARRYLDSLVEAFVRGEPLPKTASAHTVKNRTPAPKKSAVKAVPQPPMSVEASSFELPVFLTQVYATLKEQFLREVMTDLDPVLEPVYDARLKGILRRFQDNTEKAMTPVLDSARKAIFNLRRDIEAGKSIRFLPPAPELGHYYEALGMEPLREDTDAEEALTTLRKRYRALMHEHHPDKGGAHDDATKTNTAYSELVSHWSKKQSHTTVN